MEGLTHEQMQELFAAGAPAASLIGFQKAFRALTLPARPTREHLKADAVKAMRVYRSGAKLLGLWPPKPERDAVQAKAADVVKSILRATRNSFAQTYVDLIIRRVTDGYRRFVRAEELVYEVAELCPGLCPTRKEVEAESQLLLAGKDGAEVAQSDFLAHVFAHKAAGLYLIHSMLQPLPQSQELLERFRREGRLDLGTAQVEWRGPVGCVFFSNLRYLNAEDDTTVLPLEMATDLVLLSPEKGRRVFSAGLNLTHL